MGADQATVRRDVGGGVVTVLAAAGFEDAEEAGRGGFGVVYRCRQAGLDRLVAVKVLTAGLADDRARFVREQQAMARLTGHPNIVAVLEVGELVGGVPFLVMPFCGRGSVQERIARLGLLPLDEVLRLGVKMAGALASAHAFGIVHRDVKPANILLTEYDEPALGDFGIARIGGGFKTATGLFAGSPAFTAPEIIGGAPPSAASDVYGLGASLFAALTGHAAFERRAGEQVVAQLVRITREEVPDLRAQGVPDEVAAVIGAAMARDPDQRPSAVRLGQRLQQVQAGLGLPVDEMVLHDAGSERGVVQPARPRAPVPGAASNLPAAVSAVVGRAEELTRLRGLLAGSRLVTLSGVGGIGKTTLAIHAARALEPEFPDGVWLVELAELREGSLLDNVLSAALGLRDQPGRSPAEVMVGFLSPREVLLVLDNCEHLIDDVAKRVEALLRDCPRLHVVATSREVLDIGGEAVLALSPLAVPDPADDPTLGSLAGYEAVALFVERAQAALPRFVLTESNAAAVVRICARLEGLPLALELAAARVRALSVEQIAEGLSDRFALLTRGRRGAPSRQQTLAGCIQWSHRLCTSAEQHLWARLSVFAGSFDLAAVQQVCAGELSAQDCLDLLCVLVDKSIVVGVGSGDGAARFRLLDTLRDYGRAQLSGTELHAVRQRHADWYERLVAQARAQWFGPRQGQWLDRLRAEMPNVREALQFCLAENPAVALQMAAHMRPFWFLRGMLSEARRWLDLALSTTAPAPTPVRIRGLFEATGTATLQGDLPVAQARIAEARTLLESIDDPKLHGLIDCIDGQLASFCGEYERSRDCFRRALNTSDDYEVRAMSMSFIGLMLTLLGAHDEAITWPERALVLADSRGDPYQRAWAQWFLGLSLWAHGESQRAEQPLRQALNTWIALDQQWTCAYCMEILAWIAGSHRDPQRAVVLMAAAAAQSAAAGSVLLPFAEMAVWHEECERAAREALDVDEFEAAWARGDALTLDQAGAFASADGVSSA